jgi:3-phosphoshikimate 1-carboxyvinyltransferase
MTAPSNGPLPAELSLTGPNPLRGTVRVPGDKGISHRAVVLAALAGGRSRIRNLAPGDDVRATAAALGQLGVMTRISESGSGTDRVVRGTGIDALREPNAVIDCANSGTTMRVLAGLLAGRPFLSVLTGDASLLTRPMARVVEPLRSLGAVIDGRDDGRLAPLAIRGGNLSGRRVELSVASGQVKTAVLLAGLQAQGTTEVAEPQPSRDHTERMLLALGAPLERVDERTVRIMPGSVSSFELDVPGDPSSAAFFVVAACVTPGSELVIEDVCLNPARIGFVDVLVRMGARIEIVTTGERLGEPVGNLVVEAGPLVGTTIVPSEGIIDEIPALAVAAAFADGVTDIRDAAELRVKESDRIGTIGQELAQMGIGTEPRADGLMIRGGRPHAALFKSHGDHRIAMAAAIAANAIEGDSTVRGWGSVAVSYPAFADDLMVTAGMDR